MVDARREIIQHCLYGVDINPMAVEMAKLSLWLVSMDPTRPFTFLDDRMIAGDSLLGVTSIDQVAALHLDPARGRSLHEGTLFSELDRVRDQVAEVANDRRKLAGLPADDLPAIMSKRERLAALRDCLDQINLYADLVASSGLAHAARGAKGLDAASLAAVDQVRTLQCGTPGALDQARQRAQRWLATDLPAGGFARQPLHWPLAFPEVFEAGGFDAIIGNPPFLGGPKIRPALGGAYREHLASHIAHARGTNTDLIAYFVLRIHDLLSERGQTGLIATNTLAQGDTRDVGLDQILAKGITIRMATKSEPWPSKSVTLQYCAIWTSKSPLQPDALILLDGNQVAGINSSLDARSRTNGTAHRLSASKGMSFLGSCLIGLGFTMEPERARQLIAADQRNAEVLFPYLNGKDLNSSSDCAASRWVVDFKEMPESEARTWGEVWSWIEERVKPERMTKDAKAYPRMVHEWWKY